MKRIALLVSIVSAGCTFHGEFMNYGNRAPKEPVVVVAPTPDPDCKKVIDKSSPAGFTWDCPTEVKK